MTAFWTVGFPFVNVPVLSKTIDSIEDNCSKDSPPFNKIPCFAALDKLAKIAGLADATKAHGDITVNKIIPL